MFSAVKIYISYCTLNKSKIPFNSFLINSNIKCINYLKIKIIKIFKKILKITGKVKYVPLHVYLWSKKSLF